MSRKRKFIIRQSDPGRVLLTDLIPYEVPLRFSFLHIYRTLKDVQNLSPWVAKVIATSDKTPIEPYSYAISLGDGRHRTLGLIHPRLLSGFASFYNNFAGVLLHLCSKSKWSLRHPSRIATTYVVSDLIEDQQVPVDDSNEAEQEEMSATRCSSFFAYAPYSLLHRFFESGELLQLERQFSKYRRLDFAKCFPNIYTHSVSWAAKGKSVAKAESAKSAKTTFDAQFDRLMQLSNHNETHGILIGAEVSRIFAEIILQEIDARVRREVANLKEGVDYEVRRYIDDYFIFFNRSQVADEIEAAIKSEAVSFKLFVNDAKSIECQRPFITRLSAGKIALKVEILEFFDKGLQTNPKTFGANKLLQSVRVILGDYELKFCEVCSFALRNVYEAICKAHSLTLSHEERRDLLNCAVSAASHLLAVDLRFQTVIVFCRIVRKAAASAENLGQYEREEVFGVIIRECVRLLRDADPHTGCFEIANLLISLRDLPEYWRIPVLLVQNIWLQDSVLKRSDYFATVAVIYFCGDRPEYNAMRSRIIDEAVRRLLSLTHLVASTEAFCFTLDLLSCPYLSIDEKRRLGKQLAIHLGRPNVNAAEVDQVVGEIGRRNWFFDWRQDVSTAEYLKKKELSLGY